MKTRKRWSQPIEGNVIERIEQVIKPRHALIKRRTGGSDWLDRGCAAGYVRLVPSFVVIPSRTDQRARVLSSLTGVPERNHARNTLAANVLTPVRADKGSDYALRPCSELEHVRIKHSLNRTYPSVAITRG
jgi:hypothetical protein